MPLVNVTRKAETLQAFQITSSDDMLAALKYISAGGYSGHINCATSGGTAVWTMGIQSPGQTVSQSVKISDVIVIKNSAIAEVVTAAQYTAQYQAG
jgi:hypothetical protein